MDDVVNKRILLAKAFHLNGVELSQNTDPISKMMAVHNFHISIEIAVKSILLKYEIRNDKTMNIDFESMLNAIDQHKEFKNSGQKLPYRQEIRNLNQMRNMIQHHVIEPEKSSMDDWRLFSRRFLEAVFSQYFSLQFDEINEQTFISDTTLQKYLKAAVEHVSSRDYYSASCFAAAAFEYAAFSISSFLPDSSTSFFINSSLRNTSLDFGDFKEAFEKTHERVAQSERFSAFLTSGIRLCDYKKYKNSIPSVRFVMSGNPIFQSHTSKSFTEESAKWLVQFVLSSIIKWQQLGLDPKIPERLSSGAESFINKELETLKKL